MVEYYITENGKLFFCQQSLIYNNKTLIEKVGIVYDKQTDTLLKDVEAYYNAIVATMSAISGKMAEDIVMVTFDVTNPKRTVDFMNTLNLCSGCVSKQIETFLKES